LYLARWSTLLLAALMAGPALWHAFVQKDLDYVTALTRFLMAVPVSAVMLAMLRGVTARYGPRSAAPRPPERRQGSADAAD